MLRLRVPALALAVAAMVVIAGGGGAFWLCLPAALVAASWSRTRLGAAAATIAIVACAGAPEIAFAALAPHPPVLLAVIVPAASVAVLRAVQERLEAERDDLHSSAHTDPLTGVENRRSLIGRVEYEIARHTRGRRSFALVMLDVDGFKALNDRFGHAAGDELLRDFAVALKRSIRAQDTVARLGGDEFCVLAPETDGAGVRTLLERIEHAVGGVTLGVGGLEASSGTAVFPHDGRSPGALLHAADQRLLEAKRSLRGVQRPRRRAA